MPHDHYYIFFFTPIFNIAKLSDKVLTAVKFLSELYFGKNNYIIKINGKTLSLDDMFDPYAHNDDDEDFYDARML